MTGVTIWKGARTLCPIASNFKTRFSVLPDGGAYMSMAKGSHVHANRVASWPPIQRSRHVDLELALFLSAAFDYSASCQSPFACFLDLLSEVDLDCLAIFGGLHPDEGDESLPWQDRRSEATAHLLKSRAIAVRNVFDNCASGLGSQVSGVELTVSDTHDAVETQAVQNTASEPELLADRRIDLIFDFSFGNDSLINRHLRVAGCSRCNATSAGESSRRRQLTHPDKR